MNNLQSEAQLVEWLKKSENETQNEFKDLHSTRFALEGTGMYEGEVKAKLEKDMAVLLFRFHWLRKQIDEITLIF